MGRIQPHLGRRAAAFSSGLKVEDDLTTTSWSCGRTAPSIFFRSTSPPQRAPADRPPSSTALTLEGCAAADEWRRIRKLGPEGPLLARRGGPLPRTPRPPAANSNALLSDEAPLKKNRKTYPHRGLELQLAGLSTCHEGGAAELIFTLERAIPWTREDLHAVGVPRARLPAARTRADRIVRHRDKLNLITAARDRRVGEWRARKPYAGPRGGRPSWCLLRRGRRPTTAPPPPPPPRAQPPPPPPPPPPAPPARAGPEMLRGPHYAEKEGAQAPRPAKPTQMSQPLAENPRWPLLGAE
jgi:hypothetical protein